VGEGDGDWFAIVVRFFAANEDVDVVFFDVGDVTGRFSRRSCFH